MEVEHGQTIWDEKEVLLGTLGTSYGAHQKLEEQVENLLGIALGT